MVNEKKKDALKSKTRAEFHDELKAEERKYSTEIAL